MFKIPVLTLAIVASLTLPGLALAGGLGPIIKAAPRADIKAVDISGAFESPGHMPLIKIPVNPVSPNDIGGSSTGKGAANASRANVPGIVTMLDCAVEGTPSEFPDDLRVANAGVTTIPAGTRVKWQIKSPRLSGSAVFSTPLMPGKAALMPGVLRGGVPAGTACFASIVQ